MENTGVVKELNAFLKGRYMGIHQYENYIQKANDAKFKVELQRLQQDHKRHAQLVAERIQNLGGTPVESPGFTGTIQEWMSEIKGFPETDEELLLGMLKAEDKYAVELSEEIVKGDLDPDSTKLIEQIIDEDRQHVQFLKNLVSN